MPSKDCSCVWTVCKDYQLDLLSPVNIAPHAWNEVANTAIVNCFGQADFLKNEDAMLEERNLTCGVESLDAELSFPGVPRNLRTTTMLMTSNILQRHNFQPYWGGDREISVT